MLITFAYYVLVNKCRVNGDYLKTALQNADLNPLLSKLLTVAHILKKNNRIYDEYLFICLCTHGGIMNVLYYHDLQNKVDKNNGGHVVAR